MDLRTGLYLVSFLNSAFCSPEALYSVHLDRLSFKEAESSCRPGGFLTNVRDGEEFEKIQKAVWEKTNKTVTSFWIGLKKNKGQCVLQAKDLKGFHWTVDDGVYFHGVRWKEEPLSTCTDERCGLLSLDKSGGLADSACKQKYPFICKRDIKLECPPPSIFGTYDITEHPNDPYTRQITCGSGAKFTLTCSNDLIWVLDGNENADVSQLCLECKSGYTRDASGSCVDTACPNNVCSESTTPTADADPTYPNVNRNVSDDVSTNETTVHVEEHTGDVSNIVVPVIIALLIFVVLVVIVAAIVKGCLLRSVKRAQRKAEAVALNGSGSTEKDNESKAHIHERL